MTPYVEADGLTIYVGDVLAILRELPDESVDMVCTSPPYWGLRDYGTATWDGGDPDCDHVERIGGKQGGASNTLGWDPGHPERFSLPETGHALIKTQYRDVCGKCGARRVDQQIGLEATPEEYVAKMVEVFREVRRVLANHGIVWLNLGDSFFGDSPPRRTSAEGFSKTWDPANTASRGGLRRSAARQGDLKPKDLIGIPWMTAFALRADGWWLRSEDIWAKGISFCETYSGSTMPESCRDRPTKSHETVFLLTKQANYFYDQEAIREPTGYGAVADYHAQRRLTRSHQDERPGDANRINYRNVEEPGFVSTPGGRNVRSVWAIPEEEPSRNPTWEERKEAGATRGNVAPEGNVGAGTQRGVHGEGVSHDLRDPAQGRNVRSVWAINPEPFSGAHFATMPTKLAEVCILAGAPELVCATCGKPRERIVERVETGWDGSTYGERTVDATGGAISGGTAKSTLGEAEGGKLTAGHETAGFTDCGHDNYQPGRVLDPFMGSGTTLLVARRLGRHGVGIELNEEYAEIAGARLAIPDVVAKAAEKAAEPTQLLLG